MDGGGEGTISYDREKAWSSINHSILSEREKDRERGGILLLIKIK